MFKGFRECDDQGAIVGYHAFKACLPEICEPGSESANVSFTNVDNKTGVRRTRRPTRTRQPPLSTPSP
jgi:hypothetical protein